MPQKKKLENFKLTTLQNKAKKRGLSIKNKLTKKPLKKASLIKKMRK